MSAAANETATDIAHDSGTPMLAPLGDEAVTVRIASTVHPDVARRVRTLAARIRIAGLPHVREVVVAYGALTVWYDPLHLAYADMTSALEPYLRAPEETAGDSLAGTPPREHVIPVRYNGPDLAYVAAQTGLSQSEVVTRHSGRWYEVYLLGFVPGFAYLGELDPTLVLPRRPEPRPRVAAGSVAIAGAQTAVYPIDTPGGWHLIGQTSVVLFNLAADPPARLAPGDRVRFVPDS